MTATLGVLAIGNELAEGRVANDNARWVQNKFGHALALVAGDHEDDVVSALRYLNRCRVVVVTGGIGPTADDMTRSFVCRWLRCGLKVHPPTLAKIRRKMRKLGTGVFPTRNEVQATYPAPATPLPNSIGGAVGFRVRSGGTTYFFLPGVPREFVEMVRRYVAPVMARSGRVPPAIFHFWGIAESHLDSILQRELPPPLRDVYGIYPGTRGVQVILRNTRGGAKAQFRRVVGSWLSSNLVFEGNHEAEEELVRRLKQKRLRLSVAESCTAGFLGETVTRVPGSSDVFRGGAIAYSNDLKVSLLNVRRTTLARHGAVSAECAVEMARGALHKYGGEVGVSITGIAGPTGGTETKPVGTVFFGFAFKGSKPLHFHANFSGDRHDIRERAVSFVIHQLIRRLSGKAFIQ